MAEKQEGPSPTAPVQLSWDRCVERHRKFAERGFLPREEAREIDLVDWVAEGDLVAQYYLNELRRSVPELGEIRPSPLGDYFEERLLDHVRRLNGMLCELARLGRWQACGVLYDQGLLLAQTFGELVLVNPRPFRLKAGRSLYMPSVRTSNPKFTADAKAIAEAIGLSADTVGDRLTDNRVRLGALCARLVGECVHQVTLVRRQWTRDEQRRRDPLPLPTARQIKRYVGKSMKEIMEIRRPEIDAGLNDGDARKRRMESNLAIFAMMYGGEKGQLHFLCLPELARGTEGIWWKKAIEPMIANQFSSLLEQPVWRKELSAATAGGTWAAMLKTLKDYCRPKVRQFVSGPRADGIRRGR